MAKTPFSLNHKNFTLSLAFFGLLAFSLVTLSVLVWQFREAQILDGLAATTRAEANYHASESEMRFHVLYHGLEQLAAKSPPVDEQALEAWDQLGDYLMEQNESLTAILWADASGRVRYQLAVPGATNLVGEFSSQLESEPGEIILRLPLDPPPDAHGDVLALVDLSAKMAPVSRAVGQDYGFQIADQGVPLYNSEGWVRSPEALTTRTSLNLDGAGVFEFAFSPTEVLINATRSTARNLLWYSLGFTTIALVSVFFAQTAYRRSLIHQARYRQLFTGSQDAIFISDLGGDVLDANPAALALAGYDKAELAQLSIRDLMYKHEAFTPERYDAAIAHDGSVWEELRHKLGHKITVEMTLTKLSERGQPDLVLGIARDISDRKRAEDLIQLRVGMMDLAQRATTGDLIQKTVDEVCELTDSPIAFFHQVDEDQNTLSLHAWSTGTRERFCQAQGIGEHYPIEQAGVWVDCIYARQPVIHNDYHALPHRQGLPEGHPDVIRELVVPVMRAERIVAILGVGNKPWDYTQQDVDTVAYLADLCWELVDKKTAELEQTQQHQLLEAVFENAPLTMLLVDEQRRIHQASGFAAKLSDRSRQEMLGLRGGEAMRCLNTLDSPEGCGFGPQCQNCDIRSLVLTTIERESAFQQVETSLPMVVAGQEQRVHFLFSSIPLHIDGQTMALVTLVDISEQYQSQAQLQQLFNQQQALNQFTLALSGKNTAETIFQALHDHLQPIIAPQSFSAYAYDPRKNQVRRFIKAEQGVVTAIASDTPIQLDENKNCFFFQVITEQATHHNPGSCEQGASACFCLPMTVMGDVIGLIKFTNPCEEGFSQEERELLSSFTRITAGMLHNIQLIESLEERVAQRTVELEEKLEKLDRSQKAMLYMVEDLNETSAALKAERRNLTLANQELEAFSYSVSHDLRAPLRHISGYIDLVLNRYQDDLPENGQKYLSRINEAAADMAQLINSLLTFSKTSRQEMHPSNIDMTTLAEEARLSLAPEFEHRSVTWHTPPLPSARCDRYLLKLVWQNLLSNALKFTREEEAAQIEIGAEETKEEIIYFVRDNGVGFESKYGHKLFAAFQRLHSPAEFEGTGIGLATLRRIIQRHGGRTWAEGEPGHGAVFYFSLPKV